LLLIIDTHTHTHTRCCEHVRSAATYISTVGKRQVERGEEEGFRGTLTANTEPDYLNLKKAISLAAGLAEAKV